MLNYPISVLSKAFLAVCGFRLSPSHIEFFEKSGFSAEAVRKVWRENRRDIMPSDIMDRLRDECEINTHQ
jgi:hypothetical protein